VEQVYDGGGGRQQIVRPQHFLKSLKGGSAIEKRRSPTTRRQTVQPRTLRSCGPHWRVAGRGGGEQGDKVDARTELKRTSNGKRDKMKKKKKKKKKKPVSDRPPGKLGLPKKRGEKKKQEKEKGQTKD